MKKSVLVLLTVIALAIICSFVVAAKDQQGGMMMGKEQMMDKPKMAMCPMHMAQCQAMMKCQMVATEDGGIVILTCNKLMKYDSALNLVKEVELKCDMDQQMMKMKDKCKMMCPMGQKEEDEDKGDM